MLDVTTPKVTVPLTASPRRRASSIIGTTGLSADEQAKIEAAARHAAIVKAGNIEPWRQSARRPQNRVAQTLGPELESRSSNCITATSSMPPLARRLFSARPRLPAAPSHSRTIACACARAMSGHAARATLALRFCAAATWLATQGDLRRPRRENRACRIPTDGGIFAQARSAALWAARPGPRARFHAGTHRP